MNRFELLRNEAENFSTDARRQMLADALALEEKRVRNSMIPLEASHRDVMEEERNERMLVAAALLTASAALLVTGTVLAVKAHKKAVAKAEQIREELEQDKKDMIRKISRIKGRA